jgi:hypothetical protein
MSHQKVTTGARTNALYQEAQMRAAKKAQQKKLDEEKAAGCCLCSCFHVLVRFAFVIFLTLRIASSPRWHF